MVAAVACRKQNWSFIVLKPLIPFYANEQLNKDYWEFDLKCKLKTSEITGVESFDSPLVSATRFSPEMSLLCDESDM